MPYKLTLTEALCGFCLTFKHLDGRDMLVRKPPGEVIEHGKHNIKFVFITFFN